MIGVVVGPPTWTDQTAPERRRQTVHKPAAAWLGPACNLNVDPAERLVIGQEIPAAQVTCWACRNPVEAAALNVDWWPRRRKLLDAS